MTNKIKELPPFPFKFTVFGVGNNIVYTATQHPSHKEDIQVDWEEDKYGNGTWYRKDSALELLQKGDWQLVETQFRIRNWVGFEADVWPVGDEFFSVKWDDVDYTITRSKKDVFNFLYYNNWEIIGEEKPNTNFPESSLVETPNEDLLHKIKQFSQAGYEVAIHNGKYRVFPKGECFAYKCDNDEALVKTMEALSHLDSLEVE